MDSFQGITPKILTSWHRSLASNIIFYDHVSFHLKCEIDHAADGKLRDKNADECWEIIENLARYDHEGCNDAKEFLKLGSRPMPRPSSTHVPQAYEEAVYSNPRLQNQNKPPKHSSFTFRKCTSPIPQPEALGTSFKARVRDYMAAHTEKMERFENAIFKQREEINDRMAKMFRLLKELTTSKAPKKVLIREEAKSHVTKNVNSISLISGEEERNDDNDIETGDVIERPIGIEIEIPVKEAEKENEAENGIKNEPIRRVEKSDRGTQLSAHRILPEA
nr:hypothetical protein [Tanacetum cinerariifolium]